jgi:hypothetical protein
VLLFKINVILLSISFVVFLCILCVGVTFLGSAAATNGFGGPGGIPYSPLFGGHGENAAGGGDSNWLFSGQGADGEGGKDNDALLRTAAMEVHVCACV